ncbi:MAG: hypothetical protein JXA71_05200 [Chitinispirillaceae bacterium]|nr:hypothetical protein [Chitinispirillaceae bacterium]
MKQEKGKAAFESVDEVLEEKIVKNSRDHGEKGQEAGEEPSVSTPEDQPSGKTLGSPAAKWIVAAAIAAVMVFLGCLFFGKCRRYWSR